MPKAAVEGADLDQSCLWNRRLAGREDTCIMRVNNNMHLKGERQWTVSRATVQCLIIDGSGLFIFACVGRRRTGSVDSFRPLPYAGTLCSFVSPNAGSLRRN